MSKEHILKILLYRQSISFMLIISKFTETTPQTKKIRFLNKNVALLKKKIALISDSRLLHIYLGRKS